MNGIERIAFCVLLTVPCFAAPPDPFWHSLVNADATGGLLVKTGGCDGCADACATSLAAVSAGDHLDITATENDTKRFVGLAVDAGRFFGQTHRHTATSYTDLDYSLYFIIGGYVEVRENGIYRTDTTYARGDTFRIAAEGNAIKYYKNGELF